jgi:head-tail adaptor
MAGSAVARGLFHPRLQAQLAARFYPSTAVIQTQAAGQDDWGQPNGAWTTTLTGLACRIWPSKGSSEPRSADQTITIATHRAGLNSYQPTITTAMRFVCDGETYNIIAVEPDSQHEQTYLNLEIVTT